MNEKYKKLLTINEAADLLAMSKSRVRYEIFHKRMPFFKIGRSIRFDEKDLITWIDNQKKGCGL